MNSMNFMVSKVENGFMVTVSEPASSTRCHGDTYVFTKIEEVTAFIQTHLVKTTGLNANQVPRSKP